MSNKPHIFEILGINEGESFWFRGFEFKLDDSLNLVWRQKGDPEFQRTTSSILCEIINNTEQISKQYVPFVMEADD